MSEPYDELFVSNDSFDKVVLTAIVKPFAQLTEQGEFLPNTRFHELKARARVIIYLASRKVLKSRSIIAEEKATHADIANATGLPTGTVGRTVRELATAMILATEQGKYWLPSHAVSRVQGELGTSA